MNESLHDKITKEALENNHLASGISPIMTCVGRFSDWSSREKKLLAKQLNTKSKIACIDFAGSPDDLRKEGFLNAGYETYVISPVDSINKFSKEYVNCTGLIVVGKDKTTGENISFMTHQKPDRFLHNKKDIFIKHLTERLEEIKERCESGTIDARIIGGNYISNPRIEKIYNTRQMYLDSIELITAEVKKVLGFSPSVFNGPKKSAGEDNAFFDNANRRLYLMRANINPETGNFTVDGIDIEKTNWETN